MNGPRKHSERMRQMKAVKKAFDEMKGIEGGKLHCNTNANPIYKHMKGQYATFLCQLCGDTVNITTKIETDNSKRIVGVCINCEVEYEAIDILRTSPDHSDIIGGE